MIKNPAVAVAGRNYGHLDFHRSDHVISLFDVVFGSSKGHAHPASLVDAFFVHTLQGSLLIRALNPCWGAVFS